MTTSLGRGGMLKVNTFARRGKKAFLRMESIDDHETISYDRLGAWYAAAACEKNNLPQVQGDCPTQRSVLGSEPASP